MKRLIIAITLILAVCLSWGQNPVQADVENKISSAPKDAEAYFIAPADGATVTNPVVVKFGLKEMGIAPAGVEVDNTGHHHLLIDRQELPNLTQPLAGSDTLKHFGKGQTETVITLEPGEHDLQLILGNYLHIPHNQPVISNKIHITVQDS